MRLVITFVFSMFFGSTAIAGEQEDLNKCVSAAMRYAGISLGRSNYKYDGGWFSSDISWYGNTPALCQLSGEVKKLVISGKTYVVDGFAGTKARDLYSQKEEELKTISSRMASLSEKYGRFLKVMEARLKKPKPDLDKITNDFNAQAAEIKLRVLGTTQQLEMAFASDEVSARLRSEIKKLEARNSELSKNLQILKAEQRASTPPDVQKLRAKIEQLESSNDSYRKSSTEQSEKIKKLNTEVKNLKSMIAVERAEQETESQKELEQLRTEITNLREEIEAYQTPLAPLIEEINSKISEENFLGAYTDILSLREFPLYESEANNVFIETALKVVKPIPAAEQRRNLEAYKFLLKLAPDNVKHIEKVNYYEQKISDANEKKKIDDIVGIISVSDDLAKYRSKMAKAALELIKAGKCTRSQIKYYGGWVKSGERSGQYFMDCGKQRVWFDPKSQNTAYADRAISESKASEMCKNAIKRQALTQPDFHYLDTSYTVHNPRKAVTYVQGFDVKNAFGSKMKYRAYCLIQPSGNLELSLTNK